jgi:hypothetical protein
MPEGTDRLSQATTASTTDAYGPAQQTCETADAPSEWPMIPIRDESRNR